MVERCRQIMLFQGMNDEEILCCLDEMEARTKNYQKGEMIFHAGNSTSRLGILLSGSATIENNDSWGNCTILSKVEENDIFAETYALLHEEIMLVDVRANEDCQILFLKLRAAIRDLLPKDLWQYKLIRNLLGISAHKNLNLSGRSFHISPHTIRGRVLSYLSSVSLQKNAMEFDIPFDRQQLADYLNVERTALSKELGKMKKEGIIDFRRSHFLLLDHSH